MSNDNILITLEAPAFRRWTGLLSMFGLGSILLWIGITAPPANPVWLVFIIALGIGASWLAVRMYQATALRLELTEDGLRDGRGIWLARIEDIKTVERGLLAFKPSNGFMITTSRPQTHLWQPGLYWRLGRRIGVGGVTGVGQGKAMADILSNLLNSRD